MSWIKFDTATPDKPEVWKIAADLGIDPDAVVGKLLRVWTWFDTHTSDGNAPSVTKVTLDRHVSNAGFCDSMVRAGWMTEVDGVISLTNFTRHNGETAKKRALTASRQANFRNDRVTPTALPREEKKREDIKPPVSPKGTPRAARSAGPLFDQFWLAYPRKVAKADAEKAWAKINPEQPLFDEIMRGLSAAANSQAWLKDGGQFIPHPATWLNGKRWTDAVSGQPAGQAVAPRQRVMLADRLGGDA